MGMGCGAKCLKVILVTVNIIFFLAGLGIAAVGIYIRVEKNLSNFTGDDSLEGFQNALYAAAYVLIAFGGFTLVVGFCGCCGAMKESKCLLGTYIALVTVILGAEVAGGVFAYVKQDQIQKDLTKDASGYINTMYGTTGQNASSLAWDFVFLYFECCGANGTQDFDNSTFRQNYPSIKYPPSCCVLKEKELDITKINPVSLQNCTAGTGSYHTNSCSDKIVNWITDKSTIILGVAGGIAGFELLVLLAAICFCCDMDKDD